MLADSVDPIRWHWSLTVILLSVNNTFIQKRKVNVQVFPSKGKPKNNTVQVSFVAEKCMFFFMYQVDTGYLHFPSKKIPVCGTDYHKSSEYWGR